MANLGQTIEKIREDIDRGSAYDDRIRRAIAEAIHFYRSKRLGWNIKRAYATLTSGNEYVSLPSDWVEADFLQLDLATRREGLDPVTYDWIEDQKGSTDARGEPYKFAIQHRTLRLYPIPDQTYTLMLSYHYELKNVSRSASDGETNAWLDEGEELIRKHAMSDLYVLYFKDPESVSHGKMLRAECSDEILPVLESQAAREQSSGKIKPWM